MDFMKSPKFTPPEGEIVVVAHNIRSIFNVGSIIRSAEGFGVKKVFATGYTPSPDNGLPHVREKISKALHKTSLGAENFLSFSSVSDIFQLINQLRLDGFLIVGLEQHADAIALPDFCGSSLSPKIALLLGEEVRGLAPNLQKVCDQLVEIPMFGKKESFNVSVSLGIALYAFTCCRPD